MNEQPDQPDEQAPAPAGSKVFSLGVCGHCDLRFQPVDWLPHRVAGYCSAKCYEIRHPVVEPLPEAAADLFATTE